MFIMFWQYILSSPAKYYFASGEYHCIYISMIYNTVMKIGCDRYFIKIFLFLYIILNRVIYFFIDREKNEEL